MAQKNISPGDDSDEVWQENALDVSEIREEEEPSEDEEGGLRMGDIYVPPAPKPVCSSEASGPRLIITHIDNENFKSYAGKQVLGPFHKVLEVFYKTYLVYNRLFTSTLILYGT
jgi:structural maintenance of chromosome 4